MGFPNLFTNNDTHAVTAPYKLKTMKKKDKKRTYNTYVKGWKYYRLKDHPVINYWMTGGVIHQLK